MDTILPSSFTWNTSTSTPKTKGWVLGQSHCELLHNNELHKEKIYPLLKIKQNQTKTPNHQKKGKEKNQTKKKRLPSRQLTFHECAHRNGEGIGKLRSGCGNPILDQFRLLEHHTLRLLQLKKAGKLPTTFYHLFYSLSNSFFTAQFFFLPWKTELRVISKKFST